MKENRENLPIEVLPLRKAALILRTVNHHLRQQMLSHIHRHGRLTVTELYTQLGLEQSVASQHLALLRRADLVITERSGKHIYYSVNQARLKDMQQFIRELLN